MSTIKDATAYKTQRLLFAEADTDVTGFRVILCNDANCVVLADLAAPAHIAARPHHYHVGRTA